MGDNSNKSFKVASNIFGVVLLIIIVLLIGVAIYNQFINPVSSNKNKPDTTSSYSSSLESESSEISMPTREELASMNEAGANTIGTEDIVDTSKSDDTCYVYEYNGYTFYIGVGEPTKSARNTEAENVAEPQNDTTTSESITSTLRGVSLSMRIETSADLKKSNARYIINGTSDVGDVVVGVGKSYNFKDVEQQGVTYLFQDYVTEKVQNAAYRGKSQSGLIWIPTKDGGTDTVSSGKVYLRVVDYETLSFIANLEVDMQQIGDGNFVVSNVTALEWLTDTSYEETGKAVFGKLGLSADSIKSSTSAIIRRPFNSIYKDYNTGKSVQSWKSELGDYVVVYYTLENQKSLSVYLEKSSKQILGYNYFDLALQRSMAEAVSPSPAPNPEPSQLASQTASEASQTASEATIDEETTPASEVDNP